MPEPGHSVHYALARSLAPEPRTKVLDFGCGQGGTLAAIAELQPTTCLTGIDIMPDAIRQAGRLVSHAKLVVDDLNKPTKLPPSSVDFAVCHDVLEFLDNPESLIGEIVRVLRPGGTALLSHTDYDAIIICTSDKELTRLVCHAWADYPEEQMRNSDPWMGRRVASMVTRSSLKLERIDTHVTVCTSFAGFARNRVFQISDALGQRAEHGTGPLTSSQIRAWISSVKDAATRGEFFYAETVFMVRATLATA